MPRSILLLLLAPALALGAGVTACDSPRTVVVRMTIPGPDSVETPLAGTGFVALSYDRDSVLRAMEERAPTPRPNTAALDSLFAAFRGPFQTYSAAAVRAAELRDTLGALKRRLDSLPRNAPEYERLYGRFAALSDSLTAAERAAKTARVALDSARERYMRPAESLRVLVRRWQDSTYQGYESIVGELGRRIGAESRADTTDALGYGQVRLDPGRWWIYARAWDPTDPNREWYWNVPVEGDTVVLSSRNGRQLPRY